MDIQIRIEDVSSVRKRLHVEVPAELASDEFDKVARQYSRQARIPGFRRGRAPLGLVKRHFGEDIRQDVANELIARSYNQAVEEQSLHPLGNPHLKGMTFSPGQPLEYEAEFEVSPQIDLPTYKGVQLTPPDSTVRDEDVEAKLEELRENHARMVAVEDRPAEENDFVTIDLVGIFQSAGDDLVPDPIEQEDVVVEIGGEHTHPEFTRALYGLNVAEEKQLEIEYPEDYHDKKLAGHRIKFTLEVTDIKSKVLPDLDDEFARDLQCETLDEVRDKVGEQLEEAALRNREQQLKSQLAEELLKEARFEVPEVLVEADVDEKIHQFAMQLASRGVDPSKANFDWAKVRQEMRERAERDVRIGLLLAAIAEQEKIEISEEELNQELERIARAHDKSVAEVRRLMAKNERLAGLKSDLRRYKTMDFLLEEARL